MRILVVSTWLPYPPDNGSRIRVFNLLRQLAGSLRVTLLAFTDDDFEPRHLQELTPLCERVQTVPRVAYHPRGPRGLAGLLSSMPRYLFDTYSPNMARLVREELSSLYDLIIVSQLSAMPYLDRNPSVPCLLEEVELGAFRDLSNQATGLERWRRELSWRKMARFVRKNARLYRACTVVSEAEKKLLASVAVSHDRIFVLPNGIEPATEELSSTPQSPDTLIFNGALTYSSNYDAMRYFLGEIWPLVRAARPNVRMLITGRTQGVAINALPVDNGVAFTGYVEDIRALVRSSAACVVPLRAGGGTRVKVLEAMAVGTPVVSTTTGAEGLAVAHGRDILIADTPADFARCTLDLLSDPELRSRLANNARRLVETRYAWPVIGRQFQALVLELAGRETL